MSQEDETPGPWEGPPSDPAARLEWLARWGAEQQRRIDQPPTRRIRLALARTPWLARLGHWRTQGSADRVLDRGLDRVLDRGLDTSGSSLEPETEHADGVIYQPTRWHVLPRALSYLGVSDRDTFVDFGCGKGRVVHQAARWPFREVIGVEISPVLAEIARAGVAARRHQHRCEDVKIVVSDVRDFPIPDALTLGYFFDPFQGEAMDAVLRAILDSIERHPRRVRLIYVHPRLGSHVLATGRFRLLKEQRGGLRDFRVSRAAIFESY